MTFSVGIIGTGFGAQVHVPILQRHPDYSVMAISSMRPGRAEAEAQKYGIPSAYSNWRQMLRDTLLDLVVIATSPDHHHEMAAASLQAGIPVLCEKPPALNAAEMETLRNVSAQAGLVAAFNFEWRYLPERQKIGSILGSGQLGTIFHVHWSEAWPLWPRIRDEENSWQWQKHKGGGMLGAVGSHMIDALLHWFGPFANIHGFTTNHVEQRKGPHGMEPSTADDSFFLHGTFKKGASFSLQFITAAVVRKSVLEIFGSEGTLSLEGSELRCALQPNKEFTAIQYDKPMDSSSFPRSIQPYIHAQWMLYNDLAKALAGRLPPSLPIVADALRVQEAMDLMR
ncbi:Gfo/Idh/MocA family protein [Paenibacillus caui]|uniref:Gfo/Idh/MocA family protein n=1 Tax=Paenibacillus caui TaxID=2873927 RepID=UPI001CA98591|nr:Gfo/Idh/MocA family oxidoreductase [Paenibacillus caui]